MTGAAASTRVGAATAVMPIGREARLHAAWDAAMQHGAAQSFSTFPVVRGRFDVAASCIQRAWRRWRWVCELLRRAGRRSRAAVTVQMAVQRAVLGMRVRHEWAARVLQRVWRRRQEQRVLRQLGDRFYCSAVELQDRVRTIQRAWRAYQRRKMAPARLSIMKRAQAREWAIGVLTRTLYTPIQRWRKERRVQERVEAVYMIQRVYRGYRARRTLAADVRRRLVAIGTSYVAKRCVWGFERAFLSSLPQRCASCDALQFAVIFVVCCVLCRCCVGRLCRFPWCLWVVSVDCGVVCSVLCCGSFVWCRHRAGVCRCVASPAAC